MIGVSGKVESFEMCATGQLGLHSLLPWWASERTSHYANLNSIEGGPGRRKQQLNISPSHQRVLTCILSGIPGYSLAINWRPEQLLSFQEPSHLLDNLARDARILVTADHFRLRISVVWLHKLCGSAKGHTPSRMNWAFPLTSRRSDRGTDWLMKFRPFTKQTRPLAATNQLHQRLPWC